MKDYISHAGLYSRNGASVSPWAENFEDMKLYDCDGYSATSSDVARFREPARRFSTPPGDLSSRRLKSQPPADDAVSARNDSVRDFPRKPWTHGGPCHPGLYNRNAGVVHFGGAGLDDMSLYNCCGLRATPSEVDRFRSPPSVSDSSFTTYRSALECNAGITNGNTNIPARRPGSLLTPSIAPNEAGRRSNGAFAHSISMLEVNPDTVARQATKADVKASAPSIKSFSRSSSVSSNTRRLRENGLVSPASNADRQSNKSFIDTFSNIEAGPKVVDRSQSEKNLEVPAPSVKPSPHPLRVSSVTRRPRKEGRASPAPNALDRQSNKSFIESFSTLEAGPNAAGASRSANARIHQGTARAAQSRASTSTMSELLRRI